MYIMGAPMKVAKWGNSLAVRLPKDVVDKLGLKENDEIKLKTSDDPQTLTVERDDEQARREAALNVLRQFRGMMPADFKFNRDEANER